MNWLLLFLLVLAAGMLVYFVGGYWSAIPPWSRTAAKLVLPAVLLAALVVFRRRGLSARWQRLALGLLAASTGFLVAWLLSGRIQAALGVKPDSVSGVAMTKFVESLLIVVPVVVVARIGGWTRSDLYLCRGKWRAWLLIGIGSFAACAVLSSLQALGAGLAPRQLVAWIPWTILFVFSNSFMEELHFRGLLLRPAEAFLGRHGANLCIALFFTLTHAPVTYAPDIVPFLTVLFVLALLWGYIIQRTESLWGAVLFHAGADLLVMVDVYRTYGAGP